MLLDFDVHTSGLDLMLMKKQEYIWEQREGGGSELDAVLCLSVMCIFPEAARSGTHSFF